MQILLQIAILLAVQKLAPFLGFRVNERRGIPAGIRPFTKNCPEPCKRGFTSQYIKPVVVSKHKLFICMEMLPHEGNLIIRNSICQCRTTFVWPIGRSAEFEITDDVNSLIANVAVYMILHGGSIPTTFFMQFLPEISLFDPRERVY